jgi:fructokinase
VLFSGISKDEFGQTLQEVLNADGVSLALPAPLDLPTSLAIVEVDGAGPRYGFHLNGTAAFQLEETAATKAYAALGEHVAALYIGTLGLVVEPMASTGESLVKHVSPDTMVILDPNCRPSATTDHDAYRQRLSRLFSRSDVVKVSSEDLAYLSPGVTHEDSARAIVAGGATWVVISDGPGEIKVFGADQEFSADVPRVDVVDTVGAGDALVGGFLAWWIGHDLERADLANADLVRAGVTAAAAVASITCTRKGAEPPWAKDVKGSPGWEWL